MTIPFLFRVVAAILFLLAAFNIPSKINLLAAGLFCWVISTLII